RADEQRCSVVSLQNCLNAEKSLKIVTKVCFIVAVFLVDANAILAGIRLWEENTCLTFKQVTTTANQGSMLRFIKGNGCYSSVGRISNGPQDISIGYGCTMAGIVAHEIGHALGLYHEQARYDRDSHVRVLTQNIQSGYASQFSKQPQNSIVTYGIKYDYGSVMHYPPDGFSKNGRDTLETLDPNYQSTIGQRNGPSFSDAKKVNFAYCNGEHASFLNDVYEHAPIVCSVNMVAIRTQRIVPDADAQRVWVGLSVVNHFGRPKIVELLASRRHPASRPCHSPALEVVTS
uniref:Metalloendopeptidase n=1 Tax=Parascaris equorum TaxID=6256 RepID=A0A914SJP6_PAREQ